MKTRTASLTTTEKEGEVLHLRPSEIEPHPIISYFEKHNVFPVSSNEIDKMIESVSQQGFLQPIVVTVNNGKYHRIIGRRRIAVAEKLGMTVPCYIRYFASDEEVIEAWKSENFVRAHYTIMQQLKESENIKSLWSQKTVQRVKNVAKCHPALQKLVENGTFAMRSDEDIVKAFLQMPEDIQEAVAEAITAKKEVITTQYKEKIKEVVLDENLKAEVQEKEQQIKKLQGETARLQEMVEAYEDRIAESEQLNQENHTSEVEAMHQVMERNQQILKNEIKNKDAEIANLQKEKHAAYQEMSEKLQNITAKQSAFIRQLLDRYKKDNIDSIKKIADEMQAIEISHDSKGELLVLCDIVIKTRDTIIAEINALDKKVRDKIISIENNKN